LFDLGTVGIEHPVEHAARRIARTFQHQRLIKADSGMAIGESAQQPGVQAGVSRDGSGVEYQEIVAQPLHLQKLDAHDASIADAAVRRESSGANSFLMPGGCAPRLSRSTLPNIEAGGLCVT
jgi:hypothetical protein